MGGVEIARQKCIDSQMQSPLNRWLALGNHVMIERKGICLIFTIIAKSLRQSPSYVENATVAASGHPLAQRHACFINQRFDEFFGLNVLARGKILNFDQHFG